MISCKLGGLSDKYEVAIQYGIFIGMKDLTEFPMDAVGWNGSRIRTTIIGAIKRRLRYEPSMAQMYAIGSALGFIARVGRERWLFEQGEKTGYLWYDEKKQTIEELG